MATKSTIGGTGEFFIGEDKSLILEVLDEDDIPVNITGWAITLSIKERVNSDSAILSVSATVAGTYSATRASNTQRATATLTDTQTGTLDARTYQYSFKRTTDGSETILAYGPLVVEQATQI